MTLSRFSVSLSLVACGAITLSLMFFFALMNSWGDRLLAWPSARLIETQDHMRSLLLQKGEIIFSATEEQEYCFVGIGADPNLLVQRRERPGIRYETNTVVGPFFWASDSRWHITSIDHRLRTADVMGFDSEDFGPGPDEISCSKYLKLTIAQPHHSLSLETKP